MDPNSFSKLLSQYLIRSEIQNIRRKGNNPWPWLDDIEVIGDHHIPCIKIRPRNMFFHNAAVQQYGFSKYQDNKECVHGMMNTE